MDNVEDKSTEKKHKIHFLPEISSYILSTMTPTNLTRYLHNKRDKQRVMKDIPLSKLFFLLERKQPLNAISHQVHLSETIELIRGTIPSDDIRQYRGVLLNIERAMIYFFLFHWTFRFFKDYEAAKTAFKGYSSFHYIFDTLWQLQFPWELIRPTAILQPFPLTRIQEIQKIILFQQKIAWYIAKRIERESTIKKTLENIEILSLNAVKTTGITGPIARASGAIPPLITPSSIPSRQSAQHFLKYAYSNDNNLWNALRVSYAELILALNRISHLLQEFTIKSLDTFDKPFNGEATSSFSTVLGESHLTVNISDNEVTYFNFIPSQMSNMTGFIKILSTCQISLRAFVLLFFDPEMQFILE